MINELYYKLLEQLLKASNDLLDKRDTHGERGQQDMYIFLDEVAEVQSSKNELDATQEIYEEP